MIISSITHSNAHGRSIRLPQTLKQPLAEPLPSNDDDLSNISSTRPWLRAQQPAHSLNMGSQSRALQNPCYLEQNGAVSMHQRSFTSH